MGTGEVRAAVADAGPLIHLTEIGCLPILQVVDILHIPDTVWSEAIGHGSVLAADVSVLSGVRRHSLPRSQVAHFVQEHGLNELHAGEVDCLFLCRQLSVSALLTHDLAVRETASRLHLRPVGSLGIMVKAYRLGRITLSDAERHIADLYDVSSLFVTRTIVELPIEQLHQHER